MPPASTRSPPAWAVDQISDRASSSASHRRPAARTRSVVWNRRTRAWKRELHDLLPDIVDGLDSLGGSTQVLDEPPDAAAELLRLYERDAADAWLVGQHPLLGHRSPRYEHADDHRGVIPDQAPSRCCASA